VTTAYSSLVPANHGSQAAWPLLGILAPPLGLLIVLSIARSTQDFLNRVHMILAVTTCDLRTRR
jgi:hypothetical protein